jgi:hypothetical protein
MEVLDKKREVINKVYKTNKYDLFKSLKGNRPANPRHLQRLTESIKKNGMIPNPVLVNENFEVLDGQHRLEAAIRTKEDVYFTFVKDYDLKQVHAINMNQKNWTSKDYMYGYANDGLEDYIKLRDFYERFKVFNVADCIAMLSNVTSGSAYQMSEAHRMGVKKRTVSMTFNEGTWKSKDLSVAEEWANNLLRIRPHFEGFNKSSFVGTMIGMFKHPDFDFEEFLKKLKKRPYMLRQAPSREQYKKMVEDIYNIHRKKKVNLRF